MQVESVQKDLKKLENKEKAKILSRFFKTGKGEYGEGDIFLGISVPDQRKIAKKYLNLELKEIEKLIKSPLHEERLTALLILVEQFSKVDIEKQKEIYDFYLKNTDFINNWDLVDLSAPKIVGIYLLNRKNERKILYKLVKSKNLWQKRIAILTTYAFIKKNDLEDCLNFCELLLNDKHDLIHKATGWMLRELGKQSQKTLEVFLEKYHDIMPRTMLRYAIERFSDKKRKYYLQRK